MIMICDIPQTLRAYAKCIQGCVCSQNLLLIKLTVRSFFRHLYPLISEEPSKMKNRVSPARLKTLEAITRVSNKEIRYFQLLLLFQNGRYNGKNLKLTSPTEADSYAPLTDEQQYTSGQQGIPQRTGHTTKNHKKARVKRTTYSTIFEFF